MGGNFESFSLDFYVISYYESRWREVIYMTRIKAPIHAAVIA